MAFLLREAPFEDAPCPDLILLDLNMPVMSGREVLGAIVADERLAHLPVVVLTTSNAPEDILGMYRLRCSAYITKPVSFQRFVEIVQGLMSYWFGVVSLPSAEGGRA